jgi:hypothetical protein
MLFLLRPTERILLADSKPDNVMDLWHVRMGHPHDGALRRMIEVTTGVKIPSNLKSSFCDTCHRTKSTEKPFFNEGINDKLPMEEITVDCSDQVATPRGFKYSLDISCVGTTYGWTYPMRRKSDSEEILRSFINESDRSVHDMKVIRFLTSDHGGEFTSSNFENFLQERGIIHQTGPAKYSKSKSTGEAQSDFEPETKSAFTGCTTRTIVLAVCERSRAIHEKLNANFKIGECNYAV